MDEKICREHQELLKKFQKWIEERKNFPKNLSSSLLLRFLKTTQFDVDKAGELLQYNLEYRAKYPHIFTNRDMSSEEIQTVMSTFQIFPLVNFTKDNYRVTMSRLIDEDSSKFDVVNTIKWFFMVSDSYIATLTPHGIPEKEIGVLDFKNFSWWHLMKVAANLSTIRAFLRFIQEAVPYKIAQNHYINCSPVLTKIMILIKPFVKKELFEVMHFHTSGYESLYEFIPRELLPEEYGGSGGSVKKFNQVNLELVESLKDYIKNDDNWKIVG